MHHDFLHGIYIISGQIEALKPVNKEQLSLSSTVAPPTPPVKKSLMHVDYWAAAIAPLALRKKETSGQRRLSP
jgi:hypothetical protein